MLVYTILIIATLVFWPEKAYAWGPGTHLEVAVDLARDAALFAPAVAAVIKKYRDDFVYGMVSADVLVGKKFAGYLHHCHNWDVAWDILNKCKTDQERASAYGYLSHLAADIIAHNYYIPFMVIKSFDAKMKNHTYWELRFDMHVKQEIWDEMQRIIKRDHTSFDNLLEATLKRPLFSYKTNKMIFNSILLIQQFKQVRQGVEIHSKFSQWPLRNHEVKHYKSLLLDTTRDLLINLKDAECMKGEPVGVERLKYAKRMRKSLKRFVSRGLVDDDDIKRFVKRLRRELRNAVFDPDAKLPESFEAM